MACSGSIFSALNKGMVLEMNIFICHCSDLKHLMAEVSLLSRGKWNIAMDMKASLTDGNVPSRLMCFGV